MPKVCKRDERREEYQREKLLVAVRKACEKRPVSAVADHFETRGVIRVEVEKARNIALYMMFDADHNLDERVLAEQFRY